MDSDEDDVLTLPGPGVTLLPPRVDRPYSGTAYTKIWVESAAPRSIQYTDGRVFPWEWGLNPSRWGAFAEWLSLDGPFEWDMLRVRVERMSGHDAVGAAELLDYARRGAWMFEYCIAMYFSRDYFIFPYDVCTVVLDEQGKPLYHPDGDGFGWWALIPQLLMR